MAKYVAQLHGLRSQISAFSSTVQFSRRNVKKIELYTGLYLETLCLSL